MMCGRMALLLVLVALPATLARGPGNTAQCPGLSDQVQNVQDDVNDVRVQLQAVARDNQLILEVQEALKAGGDVRGLGQRAIREVIVGIHDRQAENLAATHSMGGDLEQLSQDVAQVHARQKTLEKMSEDLSGGQDRLLAGLDVAAEERLNLLTVLQELTGRVRELDSRLENLGALQQRRPQRGRS